MAEQDQAPHELRFAVLATDVVLFTIKDGVLQVLLIDVHSPPHFTDIQGLPGGLIHPKETADEAARRHLRDKGGISNAYLEQLYTFSAVDRDPRGRVVSVAYLGLVPPDQADSAASETQWMPAQEAYEVILNKKLDKRNFRKKVFSLDLIEGTGTQKQEGAHRPAQLYRFTTLEPQVVEVL